MEVIRRVGLVATKLGMSQIFDETGKAIPVTLLSVENNVVLSNKTKGKEGYNSVVIGYGVNKPHRISKSVKGICAKVKALPVKLVKEFRISNGANLQEGKSLSINHFVVGQLVDVSGITIGKGFAGSMKRHNFSGLEASHGVSISHRAHGSTGQRQDPGKVFKNKKMAGHMGNVKVTVQNLEVVDIDEELSIIAVCGAVPGHKGSVVCITDAIKSIAPVEAMFPAVYAETNL